MTTYTPLALPRVAHVAAMPLWLVGCSPLSVNHVPTPLFILHWLNTFCCTRQLGTFLFLLGSQSSRLQAAEIDRGRHLLRMDKISRLTMLTFFPVSEAARHIVAPTDIIEEHLCFFIDIFNNLLDSNLSKVSTDAKSNPEFTKPKRREMPYYKDNHICVHGSDYQFAKCLSCKMRIVEQNARICLLLGTWLEILDITHVILRGDDRIIICADDHLSVSFACMYAIGQIAKQLIFVSITSQESLPVRRNRCSFKHALSLRIVPLCVLRWIVSGCLLDYFPRQYLLC